MQYGLKITVTSTNFLIEHSCSDAPSIHSEESLEPSIKEQR